MQPMRHVMFGDEANPNHLFIVPETDVYFELIREANRTKLRAHFRGRNVTLPIGTAAQYATLSAITERGGYAFKEDNESLVAATVHDLSKVTGSAQ